MATNHQRLPVTGKCRVCGCSDAMPCLFGDAATCAWFDQDHTLCDNPTCIANVPLEELERMAQEPY